MNLCEWLSGQKFKLELYWGLWEGIVLHIEFIYYFNTDAKLYTDTQSK